MENNPTPAQGSIPSQSMQNLQQANMSEPTTSGGSKTMLWIILGLIITIAIVGVVYWYLSNQQGKSVESASSSYQSTKQDNNLQGDLDKIVVPEVDANFSEVDKDLGSL